MKLTDNTSGEVLNLPNDLLWVDEFSWAPVKQELTYTLTGALIVDTSTKQSGREISLTYPDAESAWVPRSTVAKLISWAATAGRVMTLRLEYPTDTRTFKVLFRHSDGAVEAEPVKEFPEHNNDAWFRVKINLVEIE